MTGVKMTEQELRELCERWEVTLRVKIRKGRTTPAYEAVKWFAGKTHTVYLIAGSKLPEASREALEAKLSKLRKE
jgi:acetamidase/formamidase